MTITLNAGILNQTKESSSTKKEQEKYIIYYSTKITKNKNIRRNKQWESKPKNTMTHGYSKFEKT